MSFPSPAAGSRFLPAVTDTVYRVVSDEAVSVIVKFAKPDLAGRSCLNMENSFGSDALKGLKSDVLYPRFR